MQAGAAWRKLFTKKHLHKRYFEKIAHSPSVGLDKITTKKFEESLDENIEIILRKVSDNSYVFTRYRQMLFLKGPNKNPRQICIPTVRDKLTLSVLNELVYEVFGTSCRTEMPQSIINRISKNLDKYDSFVKIDVSSFYASIEHKTLFRKIRKRIRKPEILCLIQNAIETEALACPVKEKVKRGKREQGIPEGLPISNSLANIYLADIDDEFKADGRFIYFRYVDDILILINEHDIDEVEAKITDNLSKLGLKINDKSTRGKIDQGFEYLGYFMSPRGVTVRKSSVLKLEQSLEELINKMKNEPSEYTEWKLNLKISGFIYNQNKYGWIFFYSQISDVSLLFRLDALVEKLMQRNGLVQEIKRKRYVRTYHEVTQALHMTRYVPNFDKYDIEDKRRVVNKVYKKDVSNFSAIQVEDLFRKIISKEIRDIEKDIQAFS